MEKKKAGGEGSLDQRPLPNGTNSQPYDGLIINIPMLPIGHGKGVLSKG